VGRHGTQTRTCRLDQQLVGLALVREAAAIARAVRHQHHVLHVHTHTTHTWEWTHEGGGGGVDGVAGTGSERTSERVAVATHRDLVQRDGLGDGALAAAAAVIQFLRGAEVGLGRRGTVGPGRAGRASRHTCTNTTPHHTIAFHTDG